MMSKPSHNSKGSETIYEKKEDVINADHISVLMNSSSGRDKACALL